MRILNCACLVLFSSLIVIYGGEFELECPDECDCHYFRINWVTDCSESNLTEIPYEDLSQNVYILDMNGNFVTDVRFPGGIKLRRLHLANNRLKRIERESMESLNYLIDVDLSSNEITFIDPDTFESCPGLLTIELQNNNFGSINGSFLISKSLHYLDITNCNITALNLDFFCNITALHTLNLSKNPLKLLDQGPFDPLTSLEILQLNDCQLTHISDNAFVNLEILKRLELSGNFLMDIDWTMVLGTLHRLEYLDLRNSMITNLPEDTFMNSTWLRTLILAENDLTDLDVAMTLGSNLPHLDVLDLSNCHLKGPLSEDAFINATALTTLHLSGNPLFASDLQLALGPLTNLKRLFLNNCGLKQLPESFETLKRLEELDISYNPLSDNFIKILAPLRKLHYLNMGFSNLSHISPRIFSNMRSMKRLILSGNELNPTDVGLLGNLTKLERLDLCGCGIRQPFMFQQFFGNKTYTELKEINLAGNPLVISKEFFPTQLTNIQSLDLSYCNLSSLPDNVFRKHDTIVHINLADNNFNPSNLKFLQLLNKLETIDLANNNLTTISPHIFMKNPKIISLRLVGNPFRCDCNIAEMWDWASMVKGDLGILVGSKTSPEDFTMKGAKKKKTLLCNYDEIEMIESTQRNRSIAGRRPFMKSRREFIFGIKTWAKYVRESGCEPVVRILQPMTLVNEKVIEENIALESPAWIVAIFGVTLIFVTGVATVFLGRYRARRYVTDSSTLYPTKL